MKDIEYYRNKKAYLYEWLYIYQHEKLSEEFIREFKDEVDWHYISECQKLSEDFIREFKDKVNWKGISYKQNLSEDFIREFSDLVNWPNISIHQKLSEDFISEFKYKVDWDYISCYQKLSEDFIREFQNNVEWSFISTYQKLSEDFIREFKDKVSWSRISSCQKLSEDFIREFQDEVIWYYISKYQRLSGEEFRKEFNLKVPKKCWLYKTPEFKEKYIKKNTDYPIENGMVIAYKSVRTSGHSVYNFQYHYEIGKEYECHCDYNIDMENSFGLSAWTLEEAREHYNKGKIFKVGIPIEHLGAVVHNGNKLRASKMIILEEVSQ